MDTTEVNDGATEAGQPQGAALELNQAELRVLACLVEKEITTPEYYPLTFRALVAACNQKSNRNPVLQLDDARVSEAIESLRYERKLLWCVDEAGARVPKYRHALLERFSFNPRELAVMCELMLRGPQTVGELRSRAARLAPFGSAEDVRQAVASLHSWDGQALVEQLPPGPGRREPRYAHRFGEDPPMAARSPRSTDTGGVEAPQPPSRETRITALEEGLTALQGEVASLRKALADFRRQFE